MGSHYQVKCDRCCHSYLTTDDTPPFWCGCEIGPEPERPEHLFGQWPIRADLWRDYLLPGVPESELTIVTDPDDKRFFYCVRTVDIEALCAWLKWNHWLDLTTPPPK